MLDGLFKQGKNDAQQNKGPRNDFKSSQEREAFNAGYAEQKKQQEQQKKR